MILRCSASDAEIFRAVNINSLACEGRMRRGRRCVPLKMVRKFLFFMLCTYLQLQEEHRL